MHDAQNQRAEMFHGGDYDLVFVGLTQTNPTAFAMKLTFSLQPYGSPYWAAVLEIAQTSMQVSGTGPYTITVPVTRAQTGTVLTKGAYYADLWRTDSGSSVRLAGVLFDMPQGERAPV
jgi:hypothetical protein